MGISKEKFHFTVEERILIYLLDFIKYQEKIEVLANITQEGISEEIKIERKHIPRSLKRLIEKGLIIEKMKHIKGKPQRMRAYFLTYIGENKARNLRNHFNDIMIICIDENGNKKLKSIKEIYENFNNLYSYAKIISCISLDGAFDIISIKSLKKSEKKSRIHDKLSIYKKALEQAWKDGKMTKDEKQIINSLRTSLDISETTHLKIEEEILNKIENSSDVQKRSAYKKILEKVIEDDNITTEEKVLLNKIQKRFNKNLN